MKRTLFNAILITLTGVVIYSCSKSFLERSPLGSLDENVLANKKGVEGLLIGAYSLLDGYGAGGNWDASGSNWVYGSVVGGDAHKGSDAGDQQDINPMERYSAVSTNGYFNNKWRTVYEGVTRANNVLKIMAKATDISAADQKRISAEARFLRGHYHFEAKKMWNMVPYVDEKNTTLKLANDKDIWANIEADFQYAYDNLPEAQDLIGRANKWSAGAFLAKVKMFRKDYAGALPILNAIIASGKTPKGTKYALNAKFHDSFDADTKNSPEAVFSVQYSVNDGANGDNAGWGDVLNFPYGGGPGGCCGFFQPTQDLVNSYQVDATTGLPNPDAYNSTEVKNDQGVGAADPFVPHTGTLDARLDWTVGRRGIPYLDWGKHPGVTWIRDQAYSGPYSPIKNTYKKSQEGVLTDKSFWTSGVTANNYTLIRFADVLLWAAEAEVEAGSLENARALVNQVRARAANPAGFVKDGAVNAANYKVGLYTTPWTDKVVARKAVHFERKLELAMEGHRFFDLVRWGEAAATLNSYLNYEKTKRSYLNGATFTAGVDEYFPIPQAQIDRHVENGTSTLKQNPGY
ncbi:MULTISPECIES: RagB/SusD family nutrient uptake outer membrane protein [unclassified Paraflavitalea]|uniref:RagB/SusD family nutrient uptake outer membrane protein n=1 Tax=unclassified Paraflavitalea TaxID=2798305 RepID=UPI003D3514C1